MRQIVLQPPIQFSDIILLKEEGFSVYAICDGIKFPVAIRSYGLDNQVQIEHWGYYWTHISKLRKVIATITEPDRRTPFSKPITQTVAPDQQARSRKDKK